jgi:hypothetical protein
VLATLPWEVRRALGIKRRRLAPVDPAALAPPDSAACREAEQLVAEGTSAMVASHSHGTAEANPGSRMHFMTRYLAVTRFMNHAPFEE